MNTAGWVALGIVGGGALYFASRATATVQELPADGVSFDDIVGSGERDVADSMIYLAETAFMADWLSELNSGRGLPYRDIFIAAEKANAIPSYLLARQAWQESHYRADAYNAKSGASGIMQIVPRWHPGVDVWNPAAAIPYGAGYLAKLKRQFGTWQLALMAYNWGPGNLSKWIRGGRVGFVPGETADYNREILADVAPLNPGVAFA